MTQYFMIQIESGQVKNLTCPSDKCSSQALPLQVSFGGDVMILQFFSLDQYQLRLGLDILYLGNEKIF